MKKILFILLFLISFSINAQHDYGNVIGKSKDEVTTKMKSNNRYYLHKDTTTLEFGEAVQYMLIDNKLESILENRILVITYYFKNNSCQNIKILIFGEDEVLRIINTINKSSTRISPSLWMDESILKLPVHNGLDYDVYRIDIGNVEYLKKQN